MCGFLYINDINLNLNLCERSLKKIIHRGPDESKSLKIENSFLGFNRLAIQDLTIHGSQPMKLNEMGSYDYILFNGEIYNFKDLKNNNNQLKSEKFFSKTDTEVVLRLIKNFGFKNMLSQIEGMFSILIFNEKEKKIYLARDPFGQKPLYYFNQNNKFIASSEIKSIIEYIGDIQPDYHGSLNPLFQMTLPSKNLTMFKNIKQLEKGHFLTYEIKTGKMEVKKYFDSTKLVDEKEYSRLGQSSIKECAEELNDLMIKSCNKHLISDAKIGISFSYGLDSAIIQNYSQKFYLNKNKLDLISYIPFQDNSEIFKSEIYNNCSVKKIFEKKESNYLNKMPFVSYYAENSSNQSTAMLSMVSEKAKQSGIKVMLTGDASDELFGSYFHLKEYYYKNYFEKKNYFFKKIQNLIKFNPLLSGIFNQSDSLIGNNFYLGNKSESIEQFSNLILHRGSRIKDFSKIYEKYDFIKIEAERRYSSIVHDEVFFRLERQLLRSDNYSMPYSIENRTPFLDMEIVKFCMNLPQSKNLGNYLKFGNNDKQILRQLGKNLKINKSIISKKKIGTPQNNTNYKKLIKNEKFTYISEILKLNRSEIIESLLASNSFFNLRDQYSFLSSEYVFRTLLGRENYQDISEEINTTIQ